MGDLDGGTEVVRDGRTRGHCPVLTTTDGRGLETKSHWPENTRSSAMPFLLPETCSASAASTPDIASVGCFVGPERERLESPFRKTTRPGIFLQSRGDDCIGVHKRERRRPLGNPASSSSHAVRQRFPFRSASWLWMVLATPPPQAPRPVGDGGRVNLAISRRAEDHGPGVRRRQPTVRSVSGEGHQWPQPRPGERDALSSTDGKEVRPRESEGASNWLNRGRKCPGATRFPPRPDQTRGNGSVVVPSKRDD